MIASVIVGVIVGVLVTRRQLPSLRATTSGPARARQLVATKRVLGLFNTPYAGLSDGYVAEGDEARNDTENHSNKQGCQQVIVALLRLRCGVTRREVSLCRRRRRSCEPSCCRLLCSRRRRQC